MPFIHIPPGWKIPESRATPETVYIGLRGFLKTIGWGVAGAMGLWAGCGSGKSNPDAVATPIPATGSTADVSTTGDLYPARRNPRFGRLDRPLTSEYSASMYNNFYEVTTSKDVWRYVERFQTHSWQIEVSGLVEKPQVFDIDDLIRSMPLEERLYRFRCVEAWAMAVPWTGFPFRALLDRVQPKSSAKYVRLLTFFRPEEAPGQNAPWFPWPYYEGLTLAEASNELTLLAIGIYGRELPAQDGALIRLVVPWKYGYKSIKSIVSIELTAEKPSTFWNDEASNEYDFDANVNPYVPHPRWSQARERMIDTGEFRDTQLYNGYAPYVAHLYKT
ncbi:MAG: protein-methionine-sulfoxide reductase catalytic subunit MsrP [candidate division Zixibacteria bacterium]|nr:protein-methionine-sulfoxide reductase catalytic subunit MsrP [candidate division Zixibacteria bacterium]